MGLTIVSIKQNSYLALYSSDLPSHLLNTVPVLRARNSAISELPTVLLADISSVRVVRIDSKDLLTYIPRVKGLTIIDNHLSTHITESNASPEWIFAAASSIIPTLPKQMGQFISTLLVAPIKEDDLTSECGSVVSVTEDNLINGKNVAEELRNKHNIKLEDGSTFNIMVQSPSGPRSERISIVRTNQLAVNSPDNVFQLPVNFKRCSRESFDELERLLVLMRSAVPKPQRSIHFEADIVVAPTRKSTHQRVGPTPPVPPPPSDEMFINDAVTNLYPYSTARCTINTNWFFQGAIIPPKDGFARLVVMVMLSDLLRSSADYPGLEGVVYSGPDDATTCRIYNDLVSYQLATAHASLDEEVTWLNASYPRQRLSLTDVGLSFE